MFYKHPNLLVMVVMVAIILTSIGAVGVKHTEKFHQTYTLKPGTRIKVYNIKGKIEISKWDEDKVEVNALKSTRVGKDELKKVKIEVTMNGDMEIRTKYLEKKAKVAVDYEIKVPGNVVVTNVETSNGGIELKGTQGPSSLNTSNGRIKVEDVDGDIDVEASNGQIKIEDVSGYVNAETSNGWIDIKGSAGISKVITSNGSIKVEIPDIKGNGVEIETSLGSIELYISPDLNADIEMSTSLGTVSYHDIKLAVSESKETHVRGKLGKGGPKIMVNTSMGSIDLYKL